MPPRLAILIFLLALWPQARAGDADFGERLAACAACHGAHGEGVRGAAY
jgi:cytochrome c553